MQLRTDGAGGPKRARCPVLLRLALIVGVGVAAGCDSSAPALNYDSGIGGPVSGPLDDHCAQREPVAVNNDSCHLPADAAPPGGDGEEPTAAPLFNAEGDDDDCKYHVKFQTTAAKVGEDVAMQVTVTHLVGGTPAVGAAVTVAGTVADNPVHVLPNSGAHPQESPAGAGVYTVRPIRFDQAGRWLITFHLYETCVDLTEDSPHGHASFFLDIVP